ncbi:MAG: DNA polymerase III subunit gamma/tau [Gammaproteobacteria bacterium]|nr:DNA polymerase III subunit gamma/tau [Gammaproteobacteria bacterium]
MSYQVLARKLRPADFEALVGQDHVVRALRHALDNDRLHHAYLFSGTRGVGKTTIARLLAKCLNCEVGVSSSPCGVCTICQEIAENRFIDLIEVDAASRTGVGDTRELLENAQYLPSRGRFKVYLIDEVHMLSMAAFNALLKTLEEPPEHVKFLLATTDPKKVPVTVLSRCLQFQLKNIPIDRISAYLADVLTTEEVEFEVDALAAIAGAARGSMRDALSITDQAVAYGGGKLQVGDVTAMLGLAGRDEIDALMQALASGAANRVLAVSAELAQRGVDFDELLAGLLAALHRAAVEHATGAENTEALFGPELVQLYYQIALTGYRDIQIVPDPQSGFEMTLLRMLAFTPDAPMGSTGSQAPPPASLPEPLSQPPESAAQPSGSETGLADGTPWHEIVASLELTGVARMIAEHTVVRADRGDTLELVLDNAHDTLLNDAQRSAIERALAQRLDKKLRLQIVPGVVHVETPAVRFSRLQAERQRQAEQMLESDPVVQSLLSDFGGKLDGVTPVVEEKR